MGKLLKIDKEIRAYLKILFKKKYIKMRKETEQYIRDKIPFKKVSKESQQLLRKLGIYYKKILPPDWKDKKEKD